MRRLLELDISDLNSQKLPFYKNKLTQLADFARLSRIQIIFSGLNDYICKNILFYCCTWDNTKQVYPEKEIVEIMIDIQTKSEISPRIYEIDLKF